MRAAGHEVHAPSLTGLGERAHLLGPHVDLHLHARDVAALIEYEDLVDVILVDIRGFDTLGEIMVLTSAAIGAVALARVGRRRRRSQPTTSVST